MTGPEADLKGCDLKKQSQFAGGQNGVIQAITMVYREFNR